jgi:hypothetical protein
MRIAVDANNRNGFLLPKQGCVPRAPRLSVTFGKVCLGYASLGVFLFGCCFWILHPHDLEVGQNREWCNKFESWTKYAH